MRFYRISFAFLLIAAFHSLASADRPKPVIEHGPRDSKKVALTFDACPTGRTDEYDEKVVDVLLRERAPATFFLSGRWVEKNAEKARSLASQPRFEIENHSYFHPHLMEKDDDRVKRELTRTQAIIRKVTGRRARYFRPPYGEVDERIAAIAAAVGLTVIQFDVASGDPDPDLSAKRIERSVLAEAKGGSIIVFHVNGNGVHTAEELPDVIAGLRRKGFTLVTVKELLHQSEGKEREKASAVRE